MTFNGAGPLPALGTAFNPGTGAWTMAVDAAGTGTQTLSLAGLHAPVTVTLEKDGSAHIVAASDHDLFLATGYVHARFRLLQMDLQRRQGAGRLSEIVGPVALDVDRFELRLGLLRTAQQEWNLLAAGDPARDALVAYAQGVNDRIGEDEDRHQLPGMFAILGYQPQPWTPIDSLLVKGDLTQDQDFTDTPLVMALLQKSLGPDLVNKWFPVLPPNPQSPYDLGPYSSNQVTALTSGAPVTDAEAVAAADMHSLLASLPDGLVSHGGSSNNWALAPSKTVTGGALLAGDPHLHLTLPAIWFQLTMDSPDYHASGVSIPGTPVVLIGHNQHIAWSMTDSENQATFFYEEQTDASHPGQYFWKGAWKSFDKVTYDIPVKGGKTDHLTVDLTVHGPVMTERGITSSVWWAGAQPSQDLSVILHIGQAANFQDFRNALKEWFAPTLNFVYADDAGHIGMMTAGDFPLVGKGTPWLPMPGTGDYDVIGSIPFDDLPQAFDPPSGYVWSANQRQVGPDYPYYIGTASNFFDPGYRANEIRRVLSQDKKFNADDMKALQTDTRDFLAAEITPKLVDALAGQSLSAQEQKARDLLAGWDYRMEQSSVAATVWWNFWNTYLGQTFDPYWKQHHVSLNRGEVDEALGQDLEAWTLDHPDDTSLFTAPNGPQMDAAAAMRKAFSTTVTSLTGGSADKAVQQWGAVHTRLLEGLTVPSLGYGPRADRGDGRTPLAAGGSPSTHGPSWRMVVDWANGTFDGIYPGGQSENPVSPWYENHVETWWDGLYAPMLSADQAGAAPGSVTWTLRP